MERAMRKISIIVLLILTIVSLKAETVSTKEAQEKARIFFNKALGGSNGSLKMVYTGKKLTTNRLFSPFYVYNNSKGGFVIISAENKAFPVLGYSLNENFDPSKLGDTETAFLKAFALEIEYIKYDSEPVDGAIEAWTNYENYVENILKSPYKATDPKISINEARIILENAFANEDIVYSDIYTPLQWKDIIIGELEQKESVAIGIFDKNELLPAVIYGRKNDYFKIEMTSRNNWMLRLNATEIIPSQMVTVGSINLIREEEKEETPFEEHDLFIAEVEEIERNRGVGSSIDILEKNDTPLIRANGSGHYEVILPEEVGLVNIYNLAGNLLASNSYKDTNVIHIDISPEPSGFYFALILSETGRPYGIKIYR